MIWIVLPLFLLAAAGFIISRRKNIDIIVRGRITRKKEKWRQCRHIFFCFVDHFEPLWAGADRERALERVRKWRLRYPGAVDCLRDGGGRPPQHTFFYPAEEYIPECLDMLAEMRQMGLGDVEIHLHHDDDTSQGVREKIVSFRDTLFARHGLLRKERDGEHPLYGFIHGNWALDDSDPRGRYCGVRDEIAILRETGCYADFTYPSAPHPTQPPVINKLYFATDDPEERCSHHKGEEVSYGGGIGGDLLMVCGPLAINWRKRKRRFFPAIENGDITCLNPPDASRVDLWIKTAVAVKGWPAWVFVKVHTHGAQEGNLELLLSERIRGMHEYLLSRYNDGKEYVLHYVTAWEVYRAITALATGDTRAVEMIENFSYDYQQ